jgi:2-polyprenyl-6-methoxyphenol hydroxylase-like FAD-dependent oxidoreductase
MMKKVLIIGRGVAGTIYGWALSKVGIDVTHVVRREGLPDTETLDLLDLRPGHPKHARLGTRLPNTLATFRKPGDRATFCTSERLIRLHRSSNSICMWESGSPRLP